MSLDASSFGKGRVTVFQPPEEFAEMFVPAIRSAVGDSEVVRLAFFFGFAAARMEPRPTVGIYFEPGLDKESREAFIAESIAPLLHRRIPSGLQFDILALNDVLTLLPAIANHGAEAVCRDEELKSSLLQKYAEESGAEGGFWPRIKNRFRQRN